MQKWKKLKSKLVLDTKFFKTRQDLVELPNGEIKEWTYWDTTDSAMVLGMTDDKKLVMIRQYRYLVGDDVIEFPAGSLHEDEDMESAAKREFEEESGYASESLIKLGSFYETYGQLTRQMHMFFAPKIKKTKQKLDSGEFGGVCEDIEVVLIDFSEAVSMALTNKIVYMGATLAILLLKEKLDKKEIII